jgi:mercuric ion transport protein
MVSFRKHLWAGAAAAAIGSLCCVGPLVLLTLGVSGAWIGQLTALEPYRPVFIVLMLSFFALAFRQIYLLPQRCEPGEICADPRRLRRQRGIFWLVLVCLVALIGFPWYAPLILG